MQSGRESFLAGTVAGALTASLLTSMLKRLRQRPVEEGGIPPESTIRKMTRLAIEHGATNLSQGFPNEPPPRSAVLAAAGALIAGETGETATAAAVDLERFLPSVAKGAKDTLNQYSFPFGTLEMRRAVSAYYATFCPALLADAEKHITIVLGATEGFAACLRALGCPGDRIVFFQPFHELYG